jgi:hypothetical protein
MISMRADLHSQAIIACRRGGGAGNRRWIYWLSALSELVVPASFAGAFRAGRLDLDVVSAPCLLRLH